MGETPPTRMKMDLSFPIPSNQGTPPERDTVVPAAPIPDSSTLDNEISNNVVSSDAKQHVTNGDIVDTYWDIPPIEFPKTEIIQQENREGIIGTSTYATVSDAADANTTSVLSRTKLFPESGPASQSAISDDESTVAFDLGFAQDSEPRNETKSDDLLQVSDPLRIVPEPPRRSYKPLIILIVVVSVIVLAVASVSLWHTRQRDETHIEALAACTKASAEYNKARDKLNKALDDAADERAITADQVAEPTTVNALKTAVDNASELSKVSSCDTSLSSTKLNKRAAMNTKLGAQLRDSAKGITTAAKAVADSRDAKASADKDSARDALQSAVTEAQNLLDNSLGAVADDSTRVTLESAIDAANTLLQQNDADLKSLQDAQSTLQSAIDGVNASMTELSAANAQQQQPQNQQYYYWAPAYDSGLDDDSAFDDMTDQTQTDADNNAQTDADNNAQTDADNNAQTDADNNTPLVEDGGPTQKGMDSGAEEQ